MRCGVPELPEVETVRRGLAPAMEGAQIDGVEVRHRGLRWPIAKDFEKRLTGKTVDGLAGGRNICWADLSSGDVLVMHLGMSGSFRVSHDGAEGKIAKYHHEKSKSTAHDHVVVFHMSNGDTVTFNDPRRFGSMKLVARAKLGDEPLLRSLGPEPLGNEFDAAMLAHACAGKKTSLKAALLDQRVVAGLGNIYVCEALFRARLSPKRQASTIADRAGKPNAARYRGWSTPSRRCCTTRSRPAARRCATIAAPTGRSAISSIISWVYDREGAPCPGCTGTVKRIVQNGRSTFYCPSCQK